MFRVVTIALGGAAGATARYWIGLVVGARSFPWATLAINIVGSFLLGALVAGQAGERWNPTAVAALGVGFLGAFTTFSTFSYETTSLIRDGRTGPALAYVGLSLAFCLAGSAAGYVVARAATS